MEFLNECLEYLWTSCENPAPAIARLAGRLSAEGASFDAGQAYLFLAEHGFRMKDYDAALEEFLRFLDQVKTDDPDDAELLVLAYRKAGEAGAHSSRRMKTRPSRSAVFSEHMRSAGIISRRLPRSWFCSARSSLSITLPLPRSTTPGKWSARSS